MYGDKIKRLRNNKDKIIGDYMKGQTIKSLGNDYAVSEMMMRKFLVANGVKTRHNPFERKFNVPFFITPSIELAYFMGFLLADGHIYPKESSHSGIEVSVHAKDKRVLEQFCKWTDYNEAYLSKRKDKEVWRLSYNSKLFREDFSKWGLVNNKTYFPSIPVVDDEYIRPFLLGYIDGDGSIKISRNGSAFNIVGNRKLIDWFCETIRGLGFIRPFKFEDIEGAVWKRARLYTKAHILELAQILDIHRYKHIIMDRKWNQLLTLVPSS